MDDDRFCDCTCVCDKWDRADMYGQILLIILLLIFLSFVATDGWGTLDVC